MIATRPRSLLFVPGDRPERMEKALAYDVDVLILDLEDSVAPEAKAQARETIRAFLNREQRPIPLLVRVNALTSGLIEEDIEAILPAGPDGIVLPKAEGSASIEDLEKLLGEYGNDKLPVMPIATETPAAIFELGGYRHVASRLFALTWGAEDLPAAIGASAARDDNGAYTQPYQMARALALFAAHAAGVAAIETVYPNFKDIDGLKACAARARRDGFSGMMAIHPAQIAVINAAFQPTQAEIDWARQVIAAFDKNPEAGVIGLDGHMLDAPHLSRARAILKSKRDQSTEP
ncbi:MAG: CoA ester lyase [Hyphomicrobiales bacterium]